MNFEKKKKIIQHKLGVLIFSALSVWIVSDYKKKLTNYYKYTYVFK